MVDKSSVVRRRILFLCRSLDCDLESNCHEVYDRAPRAWISQRTRIVCFIFAGPPLEKQSKTILRHCVLKLETSTATVYNRVNETTVPV